MKKLNYLRYLWRNNKYRGKNMRKKPIVAIIYDFDGTSRLSPTRRPHHCPLPHLLSCAHHIQVPYEEGQPRLGEVQPRRNSLRAASFGPPTVSFVLAIARTCIRQAPPTFRGRGLATSAVTDCLSARNHHQCITYLHNCKSPRIAITALWGLYILKSKCQRRDIN